MRWRGVLPLSHQAVPRGGSSEGFQQSTDAQRPQPSGLDRCATSFSDPDQKEDWDGTVFVSGTVQHGGFIPNAETKAPRREKKQMIPLSPAARCDDSNNQGNRPIHRVPWPAVSPQTCSYLQHPLSPVAQYRCMQYLLRGLRRV